MGKQKLVKVAKSIDGNSVARITEEDRSQRDRTVQASNSDLRAAGLKIAPYQSKYIGSLALHFYMVNDHVNRPEFALASQLIIGDVHEAIVNLGMQRLSAAINEAYGRKAPEIRQDLVPRDEKPSIVLTDDIKGE